MDPGAGGLAAMAEHNAAKAKLLYDYIDASEFFRGTVQPDSRSLMNVTFRAPTEELENRFVAEATSAGWTDSRDTVGRRNAGQHLQRPAPGRRWRRWWRHEGVRAGEPGRRGSAGVRGKT